MEPITIILLITAALTSFAALISGIATFKAYLKSRKVAEEITDAEDDDIFYDASDELHDEPVIEESEPAVELFHKKPTAFQSLSRSAGEIVRESRLIIIGLSMMWLMDSLRKASLPTGSGSGLDPVFGSQEPGLLYSAEGNNTVTTYGAVDGSCPVTMTALEPMVSGMFSNASEAITTAVATVFGSQTQEAACPIGNNAVAPYRVVEGSCPLESESSMDVCSATATAFAPMISSMFSSASEAITTAVATVLGSQTQEEVCPIGNNAVASYGSVEGSCPLESESPMDVCSATATAFAPMISSMFSSASEAITTAVATVLGSQTQEAVCPIGNNAVAPYGSVEGSCASLDACPATATAFVPMISSMFSSVAETATAVAVRFPERMIHSALESAGISR